MAGKTKTGSGKRRKSRKETNKAAGGNGSIEATAIPAMTNGTMSLARATMSSSPRIGSWPRFVRELERRNGKSRSLARLFRTEKRHALEWAMPRPAADSGLDRELRKATRAIGRTIAGERPPGKSDVRWLATEMAGDHSARISLEQARFAIALASIMPRLAKWADETNWWTALRYLISLTDTSRPTEECSLVVRQMLTIELPLILARQLKIVPACQLLGEPAAEYLIVEQSELLDSDGWIRASHVADVPQLLAIWTRSYFLLEDLGRGLDGSSQVVWEWFVRQAMRLLRGDGTWMFCQDMTGNSRDLLRAAAATSTDRRDHRIVQQLLKKPAGSASSAKRPGNKLDRESTYSEWAGLGVLRSSWSPDSPCVAVATGPSRLNVEITCRRELMTTASFPEVAVNGRSLNPVSEWEAVCDHVDKDVEYLELEMQLEANVVFQRQICLARRERFVFLADVVLCKSVERIDYRQTYTLPQGVSVMEESETRELYLCDDGPVRAMMMPLALPEWKSARSEHALTHGKSGGQNTVTLTQSGLCRNLYAGLFLDLVPKRSRQPRTWRQLTVAETLQIVSPEVAVAWRARSGKDQYVFYRSLAEPGNRTFIGQNYSGEFFVGKLQKDGTTAELLSVEP